MGDHYTKAGPCHETTSDSGNHQATFSNIRFGEIGSTVLPPTPAPTPVPTPVPAPVPAPVPPSPVPTDGCCSWDGEYCGDTSDYCKGSADQCANCNGKWCTDCKPPYTT